MEHCIIQLENLIVVRVTGCTEIRILEDVSLSADQSSEDHLRMDEFIFNVHLNEFLCKDLAKLRIVLCPVVIFAIEDLRKDLQRFSELMVLYLDGEERI